MDTAWYVRLFLSKIMAPFSKIKTGIFIHDGYILFFESVLASSIVSRLFRQVAVLNRTQTTWCHPECGCSVVESREYRKGCGKMVLAPFVCGVALALNLGVVVCDLLTFRIPNRMVLGYMVLFVVFAWAVSLSGGEVLERLGLALGVFLITYALFCWGFFGGGDVKFLTISVLWAGLAGLGSLLLVMGVVGGLLALLCLAAPRVLGVIRKGLWWWLHKAKVAKWLGGQDSFHEGGKYLAKHVPYGIAIALGNIFVLGTVYNEYFNLFLG